MHDPAGYYAILRRESGTGTIGVRFPDHPNIVTYGRNREHALEMAAEALNATLEVELDRGLPLPPPSRRPRSRPREEVFFVPLVAQIRMAFLLRSWRGKAGLSQREMAKRLAIRTQAYQRMERPGRSNVTIATLDRIAAALGRRLVIETRPVPGRRAPRRAA